MMRTRHILLVLCILGFISLNSCKKKNLPLGVRRNVSDIVRSPGDTLCLSLTIDVFGGKSPYSIVFSEPGLSGFGTNKLCFKTKSNISYTVTDSNNEAIQHNLVFESKNYDSTVYDYRNKICGTYDGIFSSSSMSYIDTNWVLVTHPPQARIISVSKDYLFNKILVGGESFYCNRFYKFSSSFYPQYSKIKGVFKNDSIFYGGQPANGPYWYSYKGKLIP